MINKNENNIIFAHFVTDIIEEKYDIICTFNVTEEEENWSKLLIIFDINNCTNRISQSINYNTQAINDLVTVISEKIDKAIVNSYLKIKRTNYE